MAAEDALKRMKEESRGLPRLRLDKLRQLECALLDGFNSHVQTGDRSKDRQVLRSVCEAEVVCEGVFSLMDLNADGQGGDSILKDPCLSLCPNSCPRSFFEKDACMNWLF